MADGNNTPILKFTARVEAGEMVVDLLIGPGYFGTIRGQELVEFMDKIDELREEYEGIALKLDINQGNYR